MGAPARNHVDWARLGSLIELPIRRLVDGRGSGARRSHRIGDGFDIAGIRSFREGDEVRKIDWAATARTGELHVRTTTAESGVRTLVALDLGATMEFGTSGWKADVAADLTNLLGHAAARRGDQVAVATGSTGTTPSASGIRAQHLLGAVVDAAGVTASDVLAELLVADTRPSVPTGLVIIVTDLFSPLFTDHADVIERVGDRHELVVVIVSDPAEVALPDVAARFTFRAPASDRIITVDLGDRTLRQDYRDAVSSLRASTRAVVERAGGQVVEVSTEGDYVSATIDAFNVLDGVKGGRR